MSESPQDPGMPLQGRQGVVIVTLTERTQLRRTSGKSQPTASPRRPGAPRGPEQHVPSSSTASTVAPLLSRAWTTAASPFRAAMWSGLGRGGSAQRQAMQPPGPGVAGLPSPSIARVGISAGIGADAHGAHQTRAPPSAILFSLSPLTQASPPPRKALISTPHLPVPAVQILTSAEHCYLH